MSVDQAERFLADLSVAIAVELRRTEANARTTRRITKQPKLVNGFYVRARHDGTIVYSKTKAVLSDVRHAIAKSRPTRSSLPIETRGMPHRIRATSVSLSTKPVIVESKRGMSLMMGVGDIEMAGWLWVVIPFERPRASNIGIAWRFKLQSERSLDRSPKDKKTAAFVTPVVDAGSRLGDWRNPDAVVRYLRLNSVRLFRTGGPTLRSLRVNDVLSRQRAVTD